MAANKGDWNAINHERVNIQCYNLWRKCAATMTIDTLSKDTFLLVMKEVAEDVPQEKRSIQWYLELDQSLI
jgi:hypothetical protein